MSRLITRRRFLIGSTLTASALGLSGRDALVQDEKVQSILKLAEGLTMHTQRLLIGDDALAREFTIADISPIFRANGTTMPDGAQYQELLSSQFSQWHLEVGGLLANRERDPFDLTIGPWMVRLGQPALNPVCLADHVEAHRTGVDGVPVARLLCELDFVVGENGVNLVGHGFKHVRKEFPGCLPVSFINELGHSKLARAVDADEQI